MDRNGFEADERKRGLCSSLTKKAIREVERLKAYLASRSKVLQTPTPADVEDYPEERTMSTVSTLDVDGVGRFFGFQGNDAVVAAIGHLRKLFTPPLRLGDFADIHSSHIDALEAVGIRTNNPLLRWGAAAQARGLLAQSVGIPACVEEKLTRLSDLGRVRGVRGIRAKLYDDMGIQTLRQMAQWTPDDFVRAAREHAECTGFKGVPRLPKEADSTVEQANGLPSLADFS